MTRGFGRREILWAVVSFEGMLLLLALTLGALAGEPPFERVAAQGGDFVRSLFATGPLLLVLIACARVKWSPFVRLVQEIEETVLPWFKNLTVFDLVVISAVAGIAEEALFRGVIQTFLSSRFGSASGLLVASVLFGAGHLLTPTYGAIATLVGAYLGTLLVLTNNLLVPIIVHSLYDFLALIYLLRLRRRSSAP